MHGESLSGVSRGFNGKREHGKRDKRGKNSWSASARAAG